MMDAVREDGLFAALVGVFAVALCLGLWAAPNPGPERLAAIEIDMADVPSDSGRDIPTPRRRLDAPTPVSPQPVRAMAPPMAAPTPVKTASVDAPTIPAAPGAVGDMAALAGPVGVAATASDAMAGFMGQGDYFELLKMRVDAIKVYPEQAKATARQGQVVVRFVLHRDGAVSAVTVAQTSGSKALDEAAARAVERAAPFPCPPAGLFELPVRLQVGVQFLLT